MCVCLCVMCAGVCTVCEYFMRVYVCVCVCVCIYCVYLMCVCVYV